MEGPAFQKVELREEPGGPPRVVRKVSGGDPRPEPSESVPGRLIVKFKPLEDPAQIAEAKARLETLSARFGVTGTTPLFKPFIPAWERQRRASGPTTQKRTGWYWYLEEKEWMPEGKGEPARGPGDSSAERVLQDRKSARVALEELHLQDIQLVTLPQEADLEAAAEAFSKDPAVEYAHPDPIVRPFALPNDTYVDGNQDGRWDTGAWGQPFADLWGLEKITADAAWVATQGEGVVVAVSDTGIDYDHPDLAANVWTNPGETGLDASGQDKRSNGIDDDANGFADDWRGYDFVTIDGTPADGDPMDDHGHGTHVAGTIAALSNNGIGIAGVAPKAKVMAVKGLSADDGSGSNSDLASGIVYAANNGARVINASWGGFGKTPRMLVDTLAYAHDARDVLFVAAAGNNASDVGGPEYGFFPANIRDAMAVSAFDSTDTRASFSNFGVKLDVGAPGGGDSRPSTIYDPRRSILSLKASQAGSDMTGSGQLVVGANYLRQAGTSMAAPHVSGVAALVRALHPEFTAEQARQAIRKGSDDLAPAGFDPYSGYGRLNARGALAQESPLEIQLTHWTPGGRTISEVDSVAIYGTANGPSLAGWGLEFGEGASPTRWDPIARGKGPITSGLLADWEIRTVPDGTHTIRLTGVNLSGEAYEDRVALTIDQVILKDPPPTPRFFAPPILFRGGETITVRGTVRPAGFRSYTIEVIRSDGTPFTPAKIDLVNRGLEPVTNGVLGTWDTGGVPAGHYRVVLKVLTATVRQISEESRVLVDPTLHPGWPKNLGILRSGPWTVSFMDHLNAVDVNGDGKADLPVGYGYSVRIFDHTGAMLPGWPQSFPFIQRGPTVGDLDGDDSPEVVSWEVVSSSSLGSTSIWSSNGLLIPGWPKPIGAEGVTLADLQDGTREIIGTTSLSTVTVLDKAGAVLPGWPRHLEAGLGRVAVGDMDRDGKKEIAVASGFTPNNLYLLRSDGGTLPGWPVAISPSLQARYLHYSYPALGDLDGDGDLEVVIGSWDGKVYAFHHDGTLVAGWPQKTNPVEVNSVAIGDVDGDRRPEVVAGNSANLLYVWRGDGSLLPGWPVTLTSGGGWGFSFFGFGTPALADVDGDGKAEVIVSSDSFSGPNHFALHAYRYDGKEAAGFPKPTASIGAFSTNSAAVADFDGDGLLELAWVDFDNNLYVWDLTAPVSSPRPWPMFRQDPGHMGCVGYWAPATGDRLPPIVYITHPHEGVRLGHPTSFVRVSALATDNVGVVGVQFKLDGADLGPEDKTAPYDVYWDIRRVADGPHTLTAVARDAAGNVTTSAPVSVEVFNDRTPPSVSILSPATLSRVERGSVVTIRASASDNGRVVGVRFYVNGRWLAFDPTDPYSADWKVPVNSRPNSVYSIVAVAHDAAGNWGISRPVWVYVRHPRRGRGCDGVP